MWIEFNSIGQARAALSVLNEMPEIPYGRPGAQTEYWVVDVESHVDGKFRFPAPRGTFADIVGVNAGEFIAAESWPRGGVEVEFDHAWRALPDGY